MELLEGNTLSDCLRNSGPMSASRGPYRSSGRWPPDSRLLTRREIIHRDFKSANVILVLAAGGTELGSGLRGLQRAVITDFRPWRVAGLVAGDDASALSQTGIVVGTPAYYGHPSSDGHGFERCAVCRAQNALIRVSTWPRLKRDNRLSDFRSAQQFRRPRLRQPEARKGRACWWPAAKLVEGQALGEPGANSARAKMAFR